jgi:RNA polymerase sigma-70 factor (ECF subfamily)
MEDALVTQRGSNNSSQGADRHQARAGVCSARAAIYWATQQTAFAAESRLGSLAGRLLLPRLGLDLQRFDGEYVRALVAGDPEVERHFARYFSDLISIKLRARRLPQAVIDDIRQETFLRTISALRRNTLDAPERLGAFVNSVCNNVLLEHYRSRSMPSLDGEGASDPPDNRPTIETSLVTAQHKEVVESVLSEMSRKDEQVLRMVVLEERNKEEVCADLKINREHLRVIVHRAKARFKELLLQRFGNAYRGELQARRAV